MIATAVIATVVVEMEVATIWITVAILIIQLQLICSENLQAPIMIIRTRRQYYQEDSRLYFVWGEDLETHVVPCREA